MREPVHQRYDRQHAVEHDKQVGKTALLGRLEERPHDVDDRQYRNVDGENAEGDREYGGDRSLRQAVERRELNGKQLRDDQHQNREPHGDDHAVAQGDPLTVGILFTVQGAEDRQQRHRRALDQNERQTVEREGYRGDLAAHNAGKGQDDRVGEEQAQEVAHIDQRGRKSDAEYLAERFQLFERRFGKVDGALLGFEVEQRQENADDIAGDGRPAGACYAPAENRHVDIVADQVDDVGDDRQRRSELAQAVCPRIGGCLVDDRDQGREHPKRKQIVDDHADKLLLALREQLSGRHHGGDADDGKQYR